MKLDDIKNLRTKDDFLKLLKMMSPKERFLTGFCAVVLLLALVRLIFIPSTPVGFAYSEEVPLDSTEVAALNLEEEIPAEEAASPGGTSADAAILAAQKALARETEKVAAEKAKKEAEAAKAAGKASEGAGVQTTAGKGLQQPYFTRPIRSWDDAEFNDVNDVQLVAARMNGIRPVDTHEQAEVLVKEQKLVFMGASPFFYLDDLKHSLPYLVPKASKLLNRIAMNYMDSLQRRGIPAHRLIVTSLLRTQSDVRKLRRSNVNSVPESCHQYATTFDISWGKFKELQDDPQGDKHYMERAVIMKRTLGEVLRDLRYEGRCYVKHERKQGCFHITVKDY